MNFLTMTDQEIQYKINFSTPLLTITSTHSILGQKLFTFNVIIFNFCNFTQNSGVEMFISFL